MTSCPKSSKPKVIPLALGSVLRSKRSGGLLIRLPLWNYERSRWSPTWDAGLRSKRPQALGKLFLFLGGMIAFMLRAERRQESDSTWWDSTPGCGVFGPCLVDNCFEGIYHWVGGPRNWYRSRLLNASRLPLRGDRSRKLGSYSSRM